MTITRSEDSYTYLEERPALADSYQNEPGEAFDFDRWANGQERCWQVSSSTVPHKKLKAHFINNPLFLQQYDIRNAEIKLSDYINKYRDSGIYLPVADGKLVQIKTEAALREMLPRLTPLPEEKLLQLGGQLNLARKQSKIIHYLTNDIPGISKHKREDLRHQVPIYDLAAFDLANFSTIDAVTFKQIIDTLPKKSAIRIDLSCAHYPLKKDFLEKILQTFETKEIFISESNEGQDIAQIFLRPENLQQLNHIKALNVKDLGKHNNVLGDVLLNCHYLTSLKLRYDFSNTNRFNPPSLPCSDQLEDLGLDNFAPLFIYALPKLKSLSLSAIKNQIDFKKLGETSPLLEELTISELTIDELYAALTAFPRLKKLTIKTDITKGVIRDSLAGIPSLNLRQLTISTYCKTLPAGVLPQLLQCCPKLTDFELDNTNDETEEKAWNAATVELPELTKLTITNQTLPDAALVNILQAGKNLETVTLSRTIWRGRENLQNRTADKKIQLPKLTSLIVKNLLDFKSTSMLIENTTQLADLKLQYDRDFEIPQNILTHPLPHLQHVSFTASLYYNNDEKVITDLLSKTTHPKKIILSNTWNSKKVELKNIIPDELEYLELNGIEIDSEQLANLLARAPNLKIIRLLNCTMTGESAIWKKLSFQSPQLTQLDISTSRLPQDFVLSVLSHSPKLTTLIAVKAKIAGNANHWPDMSCIALKEIDLTSTTLHSSTAAKILRAAKNITHFVSAFQPTDSITPIAMPKLDSLVINEGQMPESNRPSETKLTTLTITTLYSTKKINNQFKDIDLQELSELIFQPAQNQEMLNHLLAKTKALRQLILPTPAFFTPVTLDVTHKEILLTLESLTIKNLSTDLLPYCGNLRTLNLRSLNGTLDKTLTVKLDRLTSLTIDDIESLDQLELMLTSAPHLQYLELSFDKKLALPDISKILLRYLPQLALKQLKISTAIDDNTALVLKKHFPHAEIYIFDRYGYRENFDQHEYNPQVTHSPIYLSDQKSSQGQRHLGDEKSSQRPIHQNNIPAPLNRTELSLDNDVSLDPNKEFKLDQYIQPNKQGFPQPSQYILSTYDTLVIENGIIKLTQKSIKCNDIAVTQKENLHATHNKQCDDPTYDATNYYCQFPLQLLPGKLIPLPGVTTTDEMTHFEPSKNIPLTFSRDPITGRHYVMLDEKKAGGNTSSDLTLAYVLKSKTTIPIQNPLPALDIEEALRIVAAIRFEEKNNQPVLVHSAALEKLDKYIVLQALLTVMNNRNIWGPRKIALNVNGVDLLNALLKNKTGRCRQKVILVKALADSLGIPCMIDVNDCHTTLRIFYQNKWLRIDAGGYPAKETIHTMPALQKEKTTLESKRSPIDTRSTEPLTTERVKKPFHEFYDELNTKLHEYSPTKRSALLYCNSDLSLLSTAGEIMAHSKKAGEDSFYIDDLEEIGANAFSAKKGKVGSALKQFIDREAKKIPATGTLIINCSKKSKGIFNVYQALDIVRELGDIGAIPPGIKIIGLVEKAHIRSDSSFTSRFSLKPENNDDVIDDKVMLDRNFVLQRCLDKVPDDKTFSPVDLYQGDFWQSELNGKPVQSEHGFEYQNGAINSILQQTTALDSKVQGLEIINPGQGDIADLHDNNRSLYVNLLKLTAQGKTFIDGDDRPERKEVDIALTQRRYDFTKESKFEALTNHNIKDCTHILNPQTYPHFLKYFLCDNDSGKLREAPEGILFNHQKSQVLTIRVTHSLAHAGLWARFFACARANKVALRLVLDPGVIIPGISLPVTDEKSSDMTSPVCELSDKNIADLPACAVVISSNPDQSADKIASDLNARLIHVGPTHRFADLFESFQKIPGKSSTPRFKYLAGELIEKLTRGETVVLTGELSTELAQRLETLTAGKGILRINGVDTPIKGRLIVVTQSSSLLPGYVNRFNHEPIEIKKEMVAEEKAPKNVASLKPLNRLSSEEKVIDEKAERLNRLSLKMQEDNPCIFIEGPTASGKSTCVRRYLPAYYQAHFNKPVKIFEGGIERLKECLEYQEKNPNVLCVYFADEANLQADGKYNFLQGYYQQHKPGIMIDRKFYPKNPNVKIMFAGNPRNYVARQQHAFFAKHPEMVIKFADYTPAYLKKYVINPLLNKLLPKNDIDIADTFMACSQLVKSPNVVTIRNWTQMCFRMAMFVTVRGLNIKEAAAMAAYDELEGLVDDKIKLQETLFESKKNYHALNSKLDRSVASELIKKLAKNEFTLTPSRYHIARLLDDQLKIRELRLKFPEYSGDGTRCTLLEGPTAIGKTLMARAILEANGFTQLSKATPETDPTKIIHVLTATNASMDDAAFHAGYFFLYDELNREGQELRLNSYATGVDSKGNPPDREGGGLWATQNPAWGYDDRECQSSAANNRFLKINVEEYPASEHHQLLTAKNIPSHIADGFIQKRQAHQLSWREVETIADEYLTRSRTTSTVADEKSSQKLASVASNKSTFYQPTSSTNKTMTLAQKQRSVLQ